MKTTELSQNVKQTMSSREIARLTGKRHDHVLRDIRSMFAQLELSPSYGEKVEATGGRPSSVYHLDRDLTDCLLTGYSAKARMAVIKRWRELESSNPSSGFDVPTSLSGALRLAADQAEQIEQQQRQIEQSRPAVEFVDRYVSAESGNKGFRQVAKLLDANERAFREFLRDQRVMYRLGGEWMPYQTHLDAGRFVVKTGVAENEHSFNAAKFTPKGVNWIAGLWAQHELGVAV